MIRFMNQKMLFWKDLSRKSILLKLTYFIEVNTEMVVILNKKLSNIDVIIVLYQLKDFVLLDVLIS